MWRDAGKRHRRDRCFYHNLQRPASGMQHAVSTHGAGARAAGTPPTRCASRQRQSSGRQLAARPTCRAEQPGQGGRPGSAAVPPLPPPLPRAQSVDRRGLLALLAAANLALPATQATAAPAARPVQPLPVPPLTETFTSPEVRPSLCGLLSSCRTACSLDCMQRQTLQPDVAVTNEA